MSRLSEKIVLVTGGSRGIGAGIVNLLAAEGATVALTYTSRKDSAEKVLSGLKGQNHLLVNLDISQEASVDSAIDEILKKFGRIDGLVNNAGITRDQILLRMKTDDFDAVINTNLRGSFLTTRAVLKPMLKAKKGSIVNITSVIGHSGNAGQSNYAASKAGIEAFSRSVAQEFGSRSIRANCVAPGFIQTEMTEVLPETQKNAILQKIPLQKFGDPKDVANAVAFLLSDESNYITGQTLHVNGGMYM